MRPAAGGAYQVTDGLYQVRFAGAAGQRGGYDVEYELAKPVKPKFRDPGKPAPPTQLRWKILSLGYFDQQSKRYQIIQNANAVTPNVSGHTINYGQIFSGIDIKYTCVNTRLKEELVLSQSGRNSLPDPTQHGIARENAYLMMAVEFALTPANIKVFARRQTGRTPVKQGNVFAFEGDDPIDFEDADSTLHFFFPKDYAWAVNDSVTGFAGRVSVKRYFYSQTGKDYMLVGVPYSWITASPTGTLIIDPTISPVASEDVWLENAGNNGASTILLVGKARTPTINYPKKRTIIKFNTSGVPSNATVVNAQLKMRYYAAVRPTGSTDPWVDRWVQAHQLLRHWKELEADSLKRLSGVNWLAPRGKIGPGSDSTTVDANGQFESTVFFWQSETSTLPIWKSWNLTNLTQKWVKVSGPGSFPSYGVILWATNEDVNGYDLRFYSSEAVAADQPKLEVTYSTEAKTVYFLKDHLGSVRATVLDTATAPVRGYDDYDPWGYILAGRSMLTSGWSSNAGIVKNKFTGKERDDEFGINLDYFGARYYDSEIGRWLSVDPQVAREPSLAPYVYSFNNPLKFVDPDGEWPTRIHNRILQEAFKGLLEKEQIKILEKASARVDEDQSPAGAFKHAMRASFQPEEHAKLMMELFIQGREKEFFEKSGDEALAALGEALHAITDATSPAHVGFQVWHGFDTPEERAAALLHAAQESKIAPEQRAKISAMVRQYYLDLLKKKEAERKKKEEEKKRREEERRKKEEERKRKEAEKRNKR